MRTSQKNRFDRPAGNKPQYFIASNGFRFAGGHFTTWICETVLLIFFLLLIFVSFSVCPFVYQALQSSEPKIWSTKNTFRNRIEFIHMRLMNHPSIRIEIIFFDIPYVQMVSKRILGYFFHILCGWMFAPCISCTTTTLRRVKKMKKNKNKNTCAFQRHSLITSNNGDDSMPQFSKQNKKNDGRPKRFCLHSFVLCVGDFFFGPFFTLVN